MNPHDKAQQGLELLKQAVLDLLEGYPEGLRERDICIALGFKAEADRRQQDYLSYYVLGQLLLTGAITTTPDNIFTVGRKKTAESEDKAPKSHAVTLT